jgi:2-C-methyl-D-erythritol 4-phosphate cytidylyltransferase
MNFAILLSAGKSTRTIKNKPKNLICIKNKPIFTYSLDVLIESKLFNNILLVTDKENQHHYSKIISNKKYKSVYICIGDKKSRQLSLINGVDFLNKKFKLNNDDLILTHDSSRIFLTKEIISRNLIVCKKHRFSSTVCTLVDSLCENNNNSIKYVSRENKFLVQTPQTFKYGVWTKSKILVNDESTDLFTLLNLKVKKENLVIDSSFNSKITFDQDFKLLNFILK